MYREKPANSAKLCCGGSTVEKNFGFATGFSTFVEYLAHNEECLVNFLPNMYTLLVIFAVMPVTVAECERSFSTLRRLKSYLRSTTGQTRLVGLTLLNIHRDISVTPEEVARRLCWLQTADLLDKVLNLIRFQSARN